MKESYNLNEVMDIIDECLENPVYRIKGRIFKRKIVHLPSLRLAILTRLKKKQ